MMLPMYASAQSNSSICGSQLQNNKGMSSHLWSMTPRDESSLEFSYHALGFAFPRTDAPPDPTLGSVSTSLNCSRPHSFANRESILVCFDELVYYISADAAQAQSQACTVCSH